VILPGVRWLTAHDQPRTCDVCHHAPAELELSKHARGRLWTDFACEPCAVMEAAKFLARVAGRAA
jgi:hypothetical protein